MMNQSIDIPKPFKLETLIPPTPRRRKPYQEEQYQLDQITLPLFESKKPVIQKKKRKVRKARFDSPSQVDMFSGQVVKGRDIQVDVADILNQKTVEEVKTEKVIEDINADDLKDRYKLIPPSNRELLKRLVRMQVAAIERLEKIQKGMSQNEEVGRFLENLLIKHSILIEYISDLTPRPAEKLLELTPELIQQLDSVVFVDPVDRVEKLGKEWRLNDSYTTQLFKTKIDALTFTASPSLLATTIGRGLNIESGYAVEETVEKVMSIYYLTKNQKELLEHRGDIASMCWMFKKRKSKINKLQQHSRFKNNIEGISSTELLLKVLEQVIPRWPDDKPVKTSQPSQPIKSEIIIKVEGGQEHVFETAKEAMQFEVELKKLREEFEQEVIYQEHEVFEDSKEEFEDVNSLPVIIKIDDNYYSFPTQTEADEFKRQAEKNQPIDYTLESIAQDVPCLTPAQVEDVLKADQFISEQNQKGIMFTNGTGTGKTYVGLGIVKRFRLRGKKNVLIVVPSDTKVKDWITDAKDVDIEAYQLQNIKDGGKVDGVSVTTYANFRQNEKINYRTFDLVVYDESHKLNSNGSGSITDAQCKHYEVTRIPSVAKTMANAMIKPLTIHRDDPSFFKAERARKSDVYDKAKEIW